MEALTGAAAPVASPAFTLVMNGRDVTADLSPYLVSVRYTDFVEGEADTLDVRLEDVAGKFRSAWYPVKGDTLALHYGYSGKALRSAGSFEIDEIEGEGPPDVVTIRAIAAGVKHPYRTHVGKAYDNTTLAAIAQRIARRLKLRLVGPVESIPIRRVTQIHENDLTFFRRLADEYGYAFSIKGQNLVCVKRSVLRAAPATITLAPGDCSSVRWRDKIMGVVTESTVSYHDAKTKRLQHYKVQDTERAKSGESSADQVKLNRRAESAGQARAQAQAALEAANIEATQMELTLFGDPRLVAGINFNLVGMGRLSGVYHIVRTRHDIERSRGYTTDVEAKRVKPSGA